MFHVGGGVCVQLGGHRAAPTEWQRYFLPDAGRSGGAWCTPKPICSIDLESIDLKKEKELRITLSGHGP